MEKNAALGVTGIENLPNHGNNNNKNNNSAGVGGTKGNSHPQVHSHASAQNVSPGQKRKAAAALSGNVQHGGAHGGKKSKTSGAGTGAVQRRPSTSVDSDGDVDDDG